MEDYFSSVRFSHEYSDGEGEEVPLLQVTVESPELGFVTFSFGENFRKLDLDVKDRGHLGCEIAIIVDMLQRIIHAGLLLESEQFAGLLDNLKEELRDVFQQTKEEVKRNDFRRHASYN